MILRKYNNEDCSKLFALFYNTVHSINIKDYNNEQVDAWANEDIDLLDWNLKFNNSYTLVAEIDNNIVGFGNIDKLGYLDMLYVHKDYQNHGIGSNICNKLENSVHTNKITTFSSITAKSFFENRGYKVIKKQRVVRNNVLLHNYVMEKYIDTQNI